MSTSYARNRAGLRRIPLPGAFLVVTVILAAWLGWEALAAAGSHRQTAEAVLRDYAEIALAAFENTVDDQVDDLLDTAFEEVDGDFRDFRELPDPREIGWELDDAAREAGCRSCEAIQRPILLFSADLRGRTVRWAAPVHATSRDDILRLADSIATLRADVEGFDDEGVLFASPGLAGSDSTMVGYMVARDSLAGARVMGFVVPRAAMTELFAEWFDRTRLLPEPIGGGLPNDSLLHLTVRTGEGGIIYRSPVHYPTQLSVNRTLGLQNAEMAVEVAVRPEKASEVIIGGLPRSRLPLLVALLVLTLGVGVAALVQVRREARFQRLRDDFVSGVSHELRTPLAQIRMFAELQDTGRLQGEDDRERAASVIHRESRRLSHLVENILQFSRLRYNEGPGMVREELELSEAIEEGIEAMRPLLRDRSMSLEVAVEPGLVVRAGRDALTRIVVNLLDNAAKYGPEGQTVRVELRRRDGWARLTVEDEGPGVPAPDRRRIWRPYRRLERDVRARLPGTGIGLAVVSELVALHEGVATVEEAEGGGARFRIDLPLDLPPDPPPAGTGPHGPQLGAEPLRTAGGTQR